MSDRYIEVFGEAEYLEEPETWLIDIILNIQAANEDTLINDSKEYKNRLVKILLDGNIQEDELFYAGTDTYTPWWRKDRVGLNVSHKVTIKTKDRYKAYKAMEKIEELNKISKRIILHIDERKPLFKADSRDVLKARKQACENALEKAKSLVESFGMKVGQPLEIQEIEKVSRGSGNYGDYDWGGAYAAGAAAVSVGGSFEERTSEVELKGNSRIVYLKYRVKFLITDMQE